MKATTQIRPPAVAGLFYPGDAAALRTDVAAYIADGRTLIPKPPPSPKAMIAPHAGYVYSGPIAGSAYACLESQRNSVTRVIVLGPSHRVGFSGMALPTATGFETPLGIVPVDQAACHSIASLSGVVTLDRAHRDEHGLEVHLPFLQLALHSFSIVPLVVGDASPIEVAAVMEHLWGSSETLVVVSSDLSHYLPYDDAIRMDRLTTDAIEQLQPEPIHFENACGRIPVQALLLEAKRHHLRPMTLDLRNSGDTAGEKSQVVGYGAYVFTTT